MTGVIGSNVLELLRERVTSYDLLEILIFLHAHAEKAWSTGGLSERIYVPLGHIAEALEVLTDRGFLIRQPGVATTLYRYSARDGAVDQAVEDLARLCVEQRAAIMGVMNANAIERVRAKAPAAFADAFILRKKTDDG